MGQKVNPVGFRLGVSKEWGSKWYNSKNYAKWLHEDLRLKEVVAERLSHAGISEIRTEHFLQEIRIFLRVARRRLAVGRGGLEVERLIAELEELTRKSVKLDIKEEVSPDTCAQLVASDIAEQIEKRAFYRRTMRRSLQMAMEAGARGVKIRLSGRLGGGEIARAEWVKDGSLPLHTLRANIDYATATAFAPYGTIGIKVWVYKGEKGQEAELLPPQQRPRSRPPRPGARRTDAKGPAAARARKPETVARTERKSESKGAKKAGA